MLNLRNENLMPAETIFRIQIKVNQVDDLVIAEAPASFNLENCKLIHIINTERN